MLAGTRFQLFTQAPFLEGHREPEVVYVSSPAGSLGPGPSDDRMYTVFPVGKPVPYGLHVNDYGTSFLFLPPWEGPILPVAEPSPDGHFDHLEPGTPQFDMAHLFGTVRFVLDAWEGYLGGPLPFHFRDDYNRLELTMLLDVDNAFAGYGFLETGAEPRKDGSGILDPFCLNFDVVAHEVGHVLIYSLVGVPTTDEVAGEYFGFHESAADTVALISVLHFESVIEDLLASTSGNLYTLNELNRIAELSQDKQIRIASNSHKMSDFAEGFTDEHYLAEPLTGAVFDILVDVFHEGLVDRGMISPEMEDLADQVQRHPEFDELIQAHFDDAFSRDQGGFREALIEARDTLGFLLAESWSLLDPDALSFQRLRRAMLTVDRELTGGRFRNIIDVNFDWREIGHVRIGPRLPKPGAESHSMSARTLVPEDAEAMRPQSYRERWLLARSGLTPGGPRKRRPMRQRMRTPA